MEKWLLVNIGNDETVNALPMHLFMEEKEQDKMIEAVREYCRA